MADRVASHYSENLELAGVIANHLRSAGKDFPKLTTTDLATVDEFHIRGRKATLELAEKMNLDANSYVLDIGSGLGGPARTLAETYGCHVTGIDLTQAFCDGSLNPMEFSPFMMCCKERVAKSCTRFLGHANHRSAIW